MQNHCRLLQSCVLSPVPSLSPGPQQDSVSTYVLLLHSLCEGRGPAFCSLEASLDASLGHGERGAGDGFISWVLHLPLRFPLYKLCVNVSVATMEAIGLCYVPKRPHRPCAWHPVYHTRYSCSRNDAATPIQQGSLSHFPSPLHSYLVAPGQATVP